MLIRSFCLLSSIFLVACTSPTYKKLGSIDHTKTTNYERPYIVSGNSDSSENKHRPHIVSDNSNNSNNSDNKDRPYIVSNSKRYLSGPYGDDNEIKQIIETIKFNSTPYTISNRAIDLPNKQANLSLKVYKYKMPNQCGGLHFTVYEGQSLQILQYEYQEDAKTTYIRDYIQGPTPFVAAGLWGPYDHTASTALESRMLTGDGSKDGLGLLVEGSYEIGWVTSIAKWQQTKLGEKYADAVRTTGRCMQQQASSSHMVASNTTGSAQTTQDRLYKVQSGDTLTTIADKIYGDTRRWKDIFLENADKIGMNPHKLPAGITLTIP